MDLKMQFIYNEDSPLDWESIFLLWKSGHAPAVLYLSVYVLVGGVLSSDTQRNEGFISPLICRGRHSPHAKPVPRTVILLSTKQNPTL